MNAYAKSADAYLTQRIMSASPEQQAALIMEAGQRHLGRSIQALNRNDISGAATSLTRVLDAITEATLRLNYEDGGELVENLEKLYDWWTRELVAAGHLKDAKRLAVVAEQMGDIRQAWEQFHEKKTGAVQGAEPSFGNQVI
ncbi:MAG: flagellar export chaperone FliS [Geothrix sp.]|uniref:flagellar export chaperone FliS n=1 Tax=Geothrix sp. TaxID=1962974 RepID=UPI0018562036|nr:flagellar export chaperone FliS [Geothrix sp.]NWJ41144.1 flagellar export chaperone FliS [Geothrix sp.]WIL20867.1 MAG: flagellar export chaperone FliS [Geothrix sp.]